MKVKEEAEEAQDMWGEKFEESIKEKRKLLLDDTDPNSQAASPSKLSDSGGKKMTKTASAAALDMFAEHTDMFNENFDVSTFFIIVLSIFFGLPSRKFS